MFLMDVATVMDEGGEAEVRRSSRLPDLALT
jgi:hypothetical protein